MHVPSIDLSSVVNGDTNLPLGDEPTVPKRRMSIRRKSSKQAIPKASSARGVSPAPPTPSKVATSSSSGTFSNTTNPEVVHPSSPTRSTVPTSRAAVADPVEDEFDAWEFGGAGSEMIVRFEISVVKVSRACIHMTLLTIRRFLGYPYMASNSAASEAMGGSIKCLRRRS